MKTVDAETHSVTVFVAGSVQDAERSLRRQCFSEGLCVTLTPTKFIYTAGAEDGVAVGFVNYPRFPKSGVDIWDRACRVAKELMDDLYQNSALVVCREQTRWITRRPEDATHADD